MQGQQSPDTVQTAETGTHGHTTPRLTTNQITYLLAMEGRDRLVAGWGGLNSTQTVRILEERGLCTLREYPGTKPRWEARITGAGRRAVSS